MSSNISFPEKKEHTLQIENVTLRMLTYPIYEDIHQFPGTCNLNWEEIFKALKETGCGASLNMELSAKLAKQPRPIQVLRYVNGREVLTLMAKIYMA